MSLTDIESVQHVATALEASRASGVRISVAIADAAGHLLHFRRDDGALLATIEVAQVKAKTAVYFGTETRNLPFAQPFTPALLGAVAQPFAFVPGGVPIWRNGKIVGAIGVGGGNAEQDHAIASAAAKALDQTTQVKE